jgi:hypothetical protein
MMSPIGTKRIWCDVRLESVMRTKADVRQAKRTAFLASVVFNQYSSASMIVMTRLVTEASAGSGEWCVKLLS